VFGPLNIACVKVFGTLVTYQPESGDAFTVRGILDKRTEEAQYAQGVYLRLFVNTADFPQPPAQGDEVIVNGTAYKVFEVSLDVAGGANLKLREA
jgi:hypothetical protein